MTSSLSDQSQQLSPDHVIARPRRASMYDALDFTKIDASLYQRPVGGLCATCFNYLVHVNLSCYFSRFCAAALISRIMDLAQMPVRL